MKEYFTGLLAGAFLIVMVACNGSNNTTEIPVHHTTPAPGTASSPGAGAVYQQIELLARPAVKEAFENFDNHDTTNRTEPYNDPTLQGSIGTFTTTVAGRSSATASLLQSVLYPNEMLADLSQTATTGSYLGVETSGATSMTGSKFGGRELSDDIIGISLGAIFGPTLSTLGYVADDGKESPCLENDNVAYASTTGLTFPYTQAPI